MAWTIYNKGLFEVSSQPISGSTSLRLLVVAGASVPAGLTDASSYDLNFVSELLTVIGTVEAAASGYSRATLGGITLTEDDTNDRVNLTWTNPTWSNVASGETWRAVALYRFVSTDANSPIWGVDVFPSGVPTNGSDITYSGGSLRVQRA